MNTGRPTRRTRRSCPPPLPRHCAEGFTGFAVLQEFDGPNGVLLWQLLRAAVLWAHTSEPERERLFLPGAASELPTAPEVIGLDPVLAESLGTLRRVLAEPARVTTDEVVSACTQLAQWADEQGKLATAVAFMETAALAAPGDAHVAVLAGRLARQRAEYDRAETWFEHAAVLGRQSGDWSSYALAFIGIGILYHQRGNFPAARKAHQHALRTARSRGLPKIAGMAAHDLFVLAFESHQMREAERYAAVALAGYGPDHPRIHSLAHDMAVFWAQEGQFARALPVFQAVLPHIEGRAERLLTLGSIARAAGAVGDRQSFEEAYHQVWQAIETPDASPAGAAQALVALAQGAASLGEAPRSEQAALRALEIAEERHESHPRFLAEAVLDSVRRADAAERAAAERAAMESRPEPDAAADALSLELVASLTGAALSVG